MHIDLLGSMRVRRFGVEVEIPAAKPRLVLATLSINAGALVSTHQLVDELWGEHPPVSAARTVQTYVYHVRKLLQLTDNRADVDRSRSVLLTRPGGYSLRLGTNSVVDAIRFGDLLAGARDEIARGRLIEGVTMLREGLALWRGQPFADLHAGSVLSLARVRLEHMRKSALELRIDAEFQLGRHKDLVDELQGLVVSDPGHEGLFARLMVALHAVGRRAEALEVFHRLRQHLRDEFGVAPSAKVQQVFQDVLNDEQAGTAAASVPIVVADPANRRGLPPRPELVGVDHELGRLRAALTAPEVGPTRFSAVEVIGGPGAGTSTFILRAVHDLERGFADGALLVDLRGVRDDGAASTRLLCERLAAVGVPVPATDRLDEVASRFRDWSRTRRLLLAADHVASVQALAALRPAGAGSAMIVVSRFGAPGQVGDELVELGPLSADLVIALLHDTVDADRLRREPEAVSRLAELCDGNPLVTRAVARWLSCRPNLTVSRLLREVEVVPERLTRLWWNGRTIADSVRGRVEQLSSDAVAALMMIAGAGVHEIAPDTLTSHLRWGLSRLEIALDELTDAHLLEDVTVAELRAASGQQVVREPVRTFRTRRIVRLSLTPPSHRPVVPRPPRRVLDTRSIAV